MPPDGCPIRLADDAVQMHNDLVSLREDVALNGEYFARDGNIRRDCLLGRDGQRRLPLGVAQRDFLETSDA